MEKKLMTIEIKEKGTESFYREVVSGKAALTYLMAAKERRDRLGY